MSKKCWWIVYAILSGRGPQENGMSQWEMRER